MVGVSDDVNEYAMALRDTEDKLRRCPKRVRPGQAVGFGGERAVNREGWLAGSGFLGQAAGEIRTALSLLLGAAPAVFPADYATSGRAGLP